LISSFVGDLDEKYIGNRLRIKFEDFYNKVYESSPVDIFWK
jgi:hypothetical protein